jgi:hypothetical protein
MGKGRSKGDREKRIGKSDQGRKGRSREGEVYLILAGCNQINQDGKPSGVVNDIL